MSVNHYRSEVARLTKQKADLQKEIGQETAKIAKLNGDVGSIVRSINKYSSATTVQSKMRQIESKQQELVRAQKKLADLEGRLSNRLSDLTRYIQNLERTEAQQHKKLESDAKKRRDEELRHAKDITREAERQHRLKTEMSRSRMVIDLTKLPARIKVLFCASNPIDQQQLRLDEEIRAIEQKIRLSSIATQLS